MTEQSFYWAGTTIGDAGPYQDNTQWTMLPGIARAGNAESNSSFYNIGVIYSVANKLAASINGTNVDVATGASFVDGAYHESDATVSIDIGSVAARPAANPRIDYIVVRKNFSTISTYTPANSTATVGPQEARITVIRGVEAGSPVAPSLTQDTTRTTYWDIPIATVQVAVGGVLSNLTDLREYVDAETKYMWVQTAAGENITDGTDIIPKTAQFFAYMQLASKRYNLFGTFMIPQDFIDNMIVTAVVVSSGNGDIAVWEDFTYVQYSACGEAYNTHVDYLANGSGITNYTLTSGERECIAPITLSSPSAGDMALVSFYRDGIDVSDTLTGVGIHGWRIEYLGWKK